MNSQSELQAIIDNQIARLVALRARIPALTCFDMVDQRSSGLEINRTLEAIAELNADAEIQAIDMVRSFGSENAISQLERSQYRLARRDDYSDLTFTALENMQAAVLEAAE
ncbi:hypothetical protein [Brucella pseudogrignonensis]|uniref:Uncharacterized protein n=1 Tax=Brucella pseudogrignonensis TaxID=419475 RepID=A0ABU1M7G9_9HYPH|nr:hypothetical protein [Brucella pseudogrignonensis]MDR6431989.1 hypothetical protein [Brucella pseudogrignonensis]